MNSRSLFYFLFALVFFIIACNNDDDPGSGPNNSNFIVNIGDSKIPYISIDTNGESIENEPKVPADLKVEVEKSEVQKQTIGIEFRGSTSFRLSDKKSFGIETWDADGNDVDASFFNFPLEEDWALVGHVVDVSEKRIFDKTMLYHRFAYDLFRRMGRYASRTELVELEINGDYKGIYLFMEKLKRDKERIDVEKLEPSDVDPLDITGGYIIKIDKTSGGDRNLEDLPLSYFENNWDDDARYNSNISFRSEYDINGNNITFEPYRGPYHDLQYLETYFLYEYPKPDLINTEQKNYIKQYINDFETALLTDDFSTSDRTYTNFIDINSFVDFFLVNELCRNVDGYRLSTYMHKARGEKLAMGPVWDFNIGFDSGDRIPFDDWVINYNDYVSQDAWMMPFWWPRLLEDPIFKTAVKDRWTALRATTLSTPFLHSIIDQDVAYLVNNGAIDRNQSRWSAYDYDDAIDALKEFLANRSTWMDSEISNF